jgi:thioredoxin-related protein
MIIINKKIIILLFLSIFLTSCLNNNELDNTNVNNSTNIINTNDDNSKNVESIKFDSNGLNILQK